jgi:hypothetical protein
LERQLAGFHHYRGQSALPFSPKQQAALADGQRYQWLQWGLARWHGQHSWVRIEAVSYADSYSVAYANSDTYSNSHGYAYGFPEIYAITADSSDSSATAIKR